MPGNLPIVKGGGNFAVAGDFIGKIRCVLSKAFYAILKPIGLTEPFYKGGANCVIGADICATIPGFCKGIVTEAAECPNLGAIIRAIHGSRYITAASRCGGGLRCGGGCRCGGGHRQGWGRVGFIF